MTWDETMLLKTPRITFKGDEIVIEGPGEHNSQRDPASHSVPGRARKEQETRGNIEACSRKIASR